MSKLSIALILVIVLVGGLAGGYYLKAIGDKKDQPSPVSNTSTTSLISPTVTPAVTPIPSPTPTPQGPTVVFEAAGSISATDKLELTKKIVSPFTDYYADSTGSGRLLTLTLSTNTQANKVTYPYLAQAIFDSGVTQGFVVEKQGTSFKYWQPECLGPCPFTDSFKAKYPEIVNP